MQRELNQNGAGGNEFSTEKKLLKKKLSEELGQKDGKSPIPAKDAEKTDTKK